jgi:hypothetical protein
MLTVRLSQSSAGSSVRAPKASKCDNEKSATPFMLLLVVQVGELCLLCLPESGARDSLTLSPRAFRGVVMSMSHYGLHQWSRRRLRLSPKEDMTLHAHALKSSVPCVSHIIGREFSTSYRKGTSYMQSPPGGNLFVCNMVL